VSATPHDQEQAGVIEEHGGRFVPPMNGSITAWSPIAEPIAQRATAAGMSITTPEPVPVADPSWALGTFPLPASPPSPPVEDMRGG
jgi:hypothetical protein